MTQRPSRIFPRAVAFVSLAVLAVANDNPPQYGNVIPPGTEMHCHLPPTYADHELCIVDDATGTEALAVSYSAWQALRTVQVHRWVSCLRPTGPGTLHDVDTVRYWDDGLHGYGPWRPVNDSSHPAVIDDLYLWNGGGVVPGYIPSGPGNITYGVYWYDDFEVWPGKYEPATHDPDEDDDKQIAVVNSAYPGWSNIWTDAWGPAGCYLSYHWIDESGAVPVPEHQFDGGRVHIRVGEQLWVNEWRNVRSYEVNHFTGYSTVALLDQGSTATNYLYTAEENPPSPPEVVISTTEPGYYIHFRDHQGVASHMLNPPWNAVLTGDICVVEGTVETEGEVPRPDSGDAMEISWDIDPPQTVLGGGGGESVKVSEGGRPARTGLEWLPAGDEVVPMAAMVTSGPIEIEMWDPQDEHYRKRWVFGTFPDSTFWYGSLDRYANPTDLYPVEYNARGCMSSTAFVEMRILTRDWVFLGGQGRGEEREMSFGLPAISIWLSDYASTNSLEVQAGEDFSVHYAANDFSPTSLSLEIDRAFWTTATVPFGYDDRIHTTGSAYIPATTNSPIVAAVYETGTRSSVSGTDLGPRSIRLTAQDAQGRTKQTLFTVEVMREARLTGYFTPWEANPNYRDAYTSEMLEVRCSTGTMQIFVDSDFVTAVETEGYGKLHRVRLSRHDHYSSGSVPLPSQQYIGPSGGWHFADAPHGRNENIDLDINSVAQLWVNDNNRSYYNPGGEYTIPGLQENAGAFIDWCATSATLNQGLPEYPPDERHVDDTGDPHPNTPGDDPEWMDIYLVPRPGGAVGVDPDLAEGFGGRRWNQFLPSLPAETIKVYNR